MDHQQVVRLGDGDDRQLDSSLVADGTTGEHRELKVTMAIAAVEGAVLALLHDSRTPHDFVARLRADADLLSVLKPHARLSFRLLDRVDELATLFGRPVDAAVAVRDLIAGRNAEEIDADVMRRSALLCHFNRSRRMSMTALR